MTALCCRYTSLSFQEEGYLKVCHWTFCICTKNNNIILSQWFIQSKPSKGFHHHQIWSQEQFDVHSLNDFHWIQWPKISCNWNIQPVVQQPNVWPHSHQVPSNTSLNWLKFMRHWSVRFAEFNEVNESSDPLRKPPLS